MEINNLIFDFNGTLIDDVDVCLQILNEMLGNHNIPKVSKNKYLKIFTFPVKDYYIKAGIDLDKLDFKELAEFFNRRYLELFPQVKLFDDVIPVLEKYKNNKNIIILSASEQNNLNNQVKLLGLDKYFEYVLGTTSIKAYGKTIIAQEFLDKHNLDSEHTLMIGDSLHDKEVADVLKCKCILVASGHQSKARLLKANTTVVDSLSEISNYID